MVESEMSDSLLILGGCGFLGTAVVEAFLEVGWEGPIVVASRNPTSLVKNVKYRTVDLFDEDDVTNLLADVRPELVLHLVSPQHTAPPQVLRDCNITSTERLLKVCQKDPHVKALLYTSTNRAIANPPPATLTEDKAILYDESSNIHPYAKTKAIADRKVLEANGENLRTAVLRPPIIYGERGPHLDIVMDMLEKGQQKIQLGEDKTLFEIVGVENAAHAHVLAAKALLSPKKARGDIAGHAFFITDGNPMTWYGLARRIWAELGDKTRAEEVRVIPFWVLLSIAYTWEWTCWLFTLGLVRATGFNSENIKILRDGNCILSISKAERMLGYRPILPTNEGIRKAAIGAQSRRKRA